MIEWLNDTNVELVPNDFKSFPIIIDNNKAIIIDFYRKLRLIEVTTFFLYRFLSIDIRNWYLSIVIDYQFID